MPYLHVADEADGARHKEAGDQPNAHAEALLGLAHPFQQKVDAYRRCQREKNLRLFFNSKGNITLPRRVSRMHACSTKNADDASSFPRTSPAAILNNSLRVAFPCYRGREGGGLCG
jgi:hypothetical protein